MADVFVIAWIPALIFWILLAIYDW